MVVSAVMPVAAAVPGLSRATTVSPSMSTSWAMAPVALTTVPLVMSVLAMTGLLGIGGG